MPYILYKTNGNTLTTVNDASLDLTTNLTFVGKNYAGYGQIIDENFVKLLENFSNDTQPSRPLMGQLWFNSLTKRLSVCYNGAQFKDIANISVATAAPLTKIEGDLWWNSDTKQLNAYDGSAYHIIGPAISPATKSSWESAEEISGEDIIPVLAGKIGSNPIVAITDTEFTPRITSNFSAEFNNGIKKGITLAGADSAGSSRDSGYYFWGTASDAVKATTAEKVTIPHTMLLPTKVYPTLANSTVGDQSLSAIEAFSYNTVNNVLSATATAAKYADLAERYASDAIYEEGTVMIIGGTAEVTVTTTHADTAIAGIVSKNPAYRMNAEAGSDDTHPYIALRGRVPCKVAGPIKKGSMLVTSSHAGLAEAWHPGDSANAVIGKALEDFQGPFGTIEVLV